MSAREIIYLRPHDYSLQVPRQESELLQLAEAFARLMNYLRETIQRFLAILKLPQETSEMVHSFCKQRNKNLS